jgi:hypothetical protein
MATSIKKMNKALFHASLHLMEAGKYLSNVEEFRDDAKRLLEMAEEMTEIMKPEPERVTDEKMLSVLDEIMNFNNPGAN